MELLSDAEPHTPDLIAVTSNADNLSSAIGEAHRRYSRMINFREGWRVFLWQGRFSSFVMNEKHLLATARYIELNPVRAKPAKRPEDFKWSSCNAHLTGKDDNLVKAEPLLKLVGNWKDFIRETISETQIESIRRHEKTERPLGDDSFVDRLECETDRYLRKKKPGPKGPRKKE